MNGENELLRRIYDSCHRFLDMEDLMIDIKNDTLIYPVKDIRNHNSYDIISMKKYNEMSFNNSMNKSKNNYFCCFWVHYLIMKEKEGEKYGELKAINLRSDNAPKVTAHFNNKYIKLITDIFNNNNINNRG